MVGQQTLTLLILVRIQVSQPLKPSPSGLGFLVLGLGFEPEGCGEQLVPTLFKRGTQGAFPLGTELVRHSVSQPLKPSPSGLGFFV